jgi:hypothetical protein
MKYRSPEGQTGMVSLQREGTAIIYAHPGEERCVEPWEIIFYPDNDSLPLVLETLEGYEATE